MTENTEKLGEPGAAAKPDLLNTRQMLSCVCWSPGLGCAQSVIRRCVITDPLALPRVSLPGISTPFYNFV